MEDSADLAALLSRVALGDRTAFARLYQAISSHLYGALLRILKQESLAEEALQDVFLKIWQGAGNYRAERGAASTWMYAIARYRALDMLRQARNFNHESEELLELADKAPGPMDLAFAAVKSTALRKCLEELQTAQRDCLMMAYCEGYTHEEVSAHLGSPLGTVKSWIRRGLESLRKCLDR